MATIKVLGIVFFVCLLSFKTEIAASKAQLFAVHRWKIYRIREMDVK